MENGVHLRGGSGFEFAALGFGTAVGAGLGGTLHSSQMDLDLGWETAAAPP